MSRVLVTGATGFIGRQVCQQLAARGHRVRAALRMSVPPPIGACEAVVVGNIDSRTNWEGGLRDIDVVIHLAGVAGAGDAGPNQANVLEAVNVGGTRRLAECAVRTRIRRFVFLSSVKVNGEGREGRAYASTDRPDPRDDYARTKWRAELELARTSSAGALEYVVVRAPLVYGSGVGSNFLRLLQWIARRYPLPLGGIRNRRSLVSVWNLADLIERTLETPAAANRTWMVSDGEDLSTPDLVRRIAAAMRRSPRICSVPVSALRFVGTICRRSAEISRLCGSLRVDSAETCSALQWNPPLDVDAGLGRTVTWFESAR